MHLYELVANLIQLDDYKKKITSGSTEEQELQILYNYQFNRFVNSSSNASEEEKARVANFLNGMMDKYEKVISYLEEQEEYYADREDIIHYINGKKLEAQFEIRKIDDLKKVLVKENTK